MRVMLIILSAIVYCILGIALFLVIRFRHGTDDEFDDWFMLFVLFWPVICIVLAFLLLASGLQYISKILGGRVWELFSKICRRRRAK